VYLGAPYAFNKTNLLLIKKNLLNKAIVKITEGNYKSITIISFVRANKYTTNNS